MAKKIELYEKRPYNISIEDGEPGLSQNSISFEFLTLDELILLINLATDQGLYVVIGRTGGRA